MTENWRFCNYKFKNRKNFYLNLNFQIQYYRPIFFVFWILKKNLEVIAIKIMEEKSLAMLGIELQLFVLMTYAIIATLLDH